MSQAQNSEQKDDLSELDGEVKEEKITEVIFKDFSSTPKVQTIPFHTKPDLEMSEYNNPPQPHVLKLEDKGRLTQTS